MKEKSEVEKQVEVMEVPTPKTVMSNTPNLDKITGKFIVKPCQKSWVEEANPDAKDFALFDKAEIWLCAPRSRDIQDAVITNISKAEQAEFESEMNLQPGTMSPFNQIFWQKHINTLKVPKQGVVLDCTNNVKHKMFYRILESNGSKVVFGRDQLSLNSSAIILVENEEKNAKIDTQKINNKTKAFAKLATMSLNDKLDFLKVFKEGSFKVSDNTNPDLIEASVGNIVDKTPEEFLTSFDNPMYKDYIFVHNLMNKNIIVRKSGSYMVNGGEVLGVSILDVVLQLRKNESLKISLKAKLENTK